MRCTRCGGSMSVRQEARRTYYMGLQGVLVEDVRIQRCQGCGAEVTSTNPEQLHAQLALLLACKEAPLTAWEIRFLRLHLGLSDSALARRVGVTRETVARWERPDAPLKMSPKAERLLRLMTVHEQRHPGGHPTSRPF